jgi:hypothetical protein
MNVSDKRVPVAIERQGYSSSYADHVKYAREGGENLVRTSQLTCTFADEIKSRIR